MKRLRNLRLFFYRLFSILVMVGSIGSGTVLQTVPVRAAAPAAPAAEPTNTLTLNVISAVKGQNNSEVPVPKYKYIINVDNTGTTGLVKPDKWGNLPQVCSPVMIEVINPVTGETKPTDQPNPDYPESCPWLSIAGSASYAPIVTQGNQSDFANGGFDLPDDRYLISVLADGYRLGGAHFTVPMSGPITVELQPFPLPDATVRTWVFEDISPTNGAPDAPAEHGLGGFEGHLVDYIDFVTTDVYGNPLCTRYEGEDPDTFQIPAASLDADGVPVPRADLPSGKCLSKMLGTVEQAAANPYEYTTDPLQVGMLAIPHLGPNRYALSVVRPDGSNWIQTTTLEGNHDWDAWVMEGATGYDTEFVVAGEPFPATFFGFVQPTDTFANLEQLPDGGIKSVVAAVNAYVPPKGGITGEPGLMGAKVNHVIEGPWISLSDLNNGDTAVWIGQGNPDGSFSIPNVPDGDYFIAIWDEPQDYILSFFNVSVRNGETVDLGVTNLNGWWTTLQGYVFNDLNANGRREPGEPGLANYPVVMRKRENSVMDRGAVLVTTDATGYYFMENAYPMTQWLVMEAYSDLYYTTGVTYQADNQAEPTTVRGQGVDVNVLPIIGLGGWMDWGVHAYDGKGTNPRVLDNGGIVGSVSYDTTRNELDPRFVAVEDWQPGIPGMTVNLYQPVPCNGAPNCDASGRYLLADDGSFAKVLINTAVTETWERPTGCVARDVNGDPLLYGTDQSVLPYGGTDATGFQDQSKDCIEAPLMGVQFGPMEADGNFGAAVNGNFGFGDGCFAPNIFDQTNGTCLDTNDEDAFATLPAGDYIVEVVSPNDTIHGRPLYQVTREEDINIANGDQFVPQIPPPQCVGALHTVDVLGVGTDGYPANTTFIPGVTVKASTPVDNPTFAADLNGSYYEGKPRPLCDAKLVTLSNGKSTAPLFTFFTEVPIPGRFWGLLVDNLNFSSNPRSQAYGEKAGIPFAPVGIYDYTNRLVTTVESDYNGLWDVLLPSTNRINCPTPSGVCAGMYRAVGNDPGIPGRLNANYNPQFRTIAAEFEVFPGLIVPADLAPTQVGVAVQLPGGQVNQAAACLVNESSADAVPEFYAINEPWMYVGDTSTFTIQGAHFGASQGSGSVTLGGVPVNIDSWSDTDITFTVPATIGAGPHQLLVTSGNGKRTINALTFHVVINGGDGGAGVYNPIVYKVDPMVTEDPTLNQYHTIQAALDAAAAHPKALVVVYPGDANTDPTNPRYNPRGAYYENLIITSPVKLQGVGPGGPNGSVPGSVIDGSAFGGDTALAEAWRLRIEALFTALPDGTDVPTWLGNPNVYEGQTIYLLAFSETQYGKPFNAAIDGFDLRGGDQMGQANTVAQGGAIFANAYVRYLQISNNLVQNNSGTYGVIRFGTPDLPAPDTNQHNEFALIAHNRIIANAGTNLAGGIALFTGSDDYEVAFNDICGNFSAEYGGGISHYGLSDQGKIHDNRIYFNQSYDEGGGIMIAGALAADPLAFYGTPNGPQGAGKVQIYNNLVQSNLANDDGGGIRFLMAGNFPMEVYNNILVNNVSTHEGGGISLNDAPKVNFYNNTVMKNLTTATALTSTGVPAPAGLSTSFNSNQLQATLPVGSPSFSDPLLFNNIFWDNRAGSRGLGTVFGLGLGGAADFINPWDMGVAGSPVTNGVPDFRLSPTDSLMQTTLGTYPSITNIVADSGLYPDPANDPANPAVVQTYDTQVTFQNWRTNTNFIGAAMVAMDLLPLQVSDYHLIDNTSPAYNAGAASKDGILAPLFDIDNQARPAFGAYDIGADEIPQFGELSITKTDGVTSVIAGNSLTYTITVSNTGGSAISGASVTDTFPSELHNVTWTCSASAGSSCTTASGSGSINATVDLLAGGSATFSASGMVDPDASANTLSNTASVAAVGITETNLADNSATDTDTILHVADLSITKSDGVTSVTRGSTVTYHILVSNAGPSAAYGARVNDSFPGTLSGVTWTCSATNGTCGTASGNGNINNRQVDLQPGGSAIFTAVGRLSETTADTSLANTATVSTANNASDPNLGNNSATDTDAIVKPTLAVLDTFGTTCSALADLSGSWTFTTGTNRIRINTSCQAYAAGSSTTAIRNAIWTSSSFGSYQAAALTFINTANNNSALILKASTAGGTSPSTHIRVRYQSGSGGQVLVQTTTNGGSSYITRATLMTYGTLTANDVLTAVVFSDGVVNVFKNDTFLGSIQLPTNGANAWTTGGGRIGMQLLNGNNTIANAATVDNFSGGSLP